MEQFGWWEELISPLGDWSSVLMGCGVESAILQNTGVLTMPEWCVTNWGVLVSIRSYSVENSLL